jgi:hypothetical protein
MGVDARFRIKLAVLAASNSNDEHESKGQIARGIVCKPAVAIDEPVSRVRRLILATSPIWTGSEPPMKTMGVVPVAAFAALPEG